MDIVETPVEPKRRGRPQGAKDRIPRKKAPEPQEAPEPEALPQASPQALPEPPPQASQALPEPPPQAPQALPEPPPEPKKKGRPYGAKDRVSRKIQIAEDAPEPASQASQSSQPQASPDPEPEPDPHVLLRQAADHLVQLKRLANCRAKAKTCEAYTQKLHSLTPSACF